MRPIAVVLLLAAALPAFAAEPKVETPPVLPEGFAPATTYASGRTVDDGSGGWRYQWPGLYFETAFEGSEVAFTTGTGDVIVHVHVDDQPVATLVKPAPGAHRIGGLADGVHRVRVEAATESQAGPLSFGGFFLPAGNTDVALSPRTRRIEFIGDSHTVGYGNTSAKRECSQDEIWRTTDNTRAFGPQVARHYGADYRVHAISGRGVVRNYGGGAGDTLPQAYRWRLLDHGAPDTDDGWQPQVLVIALGTNDFSTPLGANERWRDRQALHADYLRTYVAFVDSLHARHPQAQIVLWATDRADGEIQAQVRKVIAQLNSAGLTQVSFVPVDGLAMGGCDWHPSLDDHARIAGLLIQHLDGLNVWPD